MASGAEVRQGAERYRFDGVVVDAAAHTLVRDGGIQQVEPKAFAVLLELLRHPGELIDRDRLLDAVWGHRHVTPGVLTRAIAQLRTALNDNALHPRYIQTQHALGYRFVGTLEEEPEAVPAESAPDASVEGEPYRPMPHAGTERRLEPRYQAGLWLLAALLLALALAWGARQHRGAPALAVSPSIAVLPFTTLSDDRRDDYFAEGLATEMHSALAGVRGIKVAAWLPPEAIDRKLDMQALGRKLGVATVLDATVRREGQRFRISARLSDTGNGVTLWSRTYERDAAAIFDTQSEIASEVATTLVGVLPDAGEGLRKRLTPTRNFAAFDAYLLGMWQLMKPRSEVAEGEAIASFNNALAQDAKFARAQAGICRGHIWQFIAARSVDALNRATQACDRARQMDPRIGAVQLALGDLYAATGETQKALMHYRAAENDASEKANALVGEAKAHASTGNPELAMRLFTQALELSPGNPLILGRLGYMQYQAGAVQEGITSLAKAVDLDPGNARLWSTYGGMLMASGRNADAIHAFEKSMSIEPLEHVIGNLGLLKYEAGNYREAADLHRKSIALDSDNFELWGNLADALAELPDGAAQARDAYSKAAGMAESFLAHKSDDAMAYSLLAWYRANLGDAAGARESIRRAEALPVGQDEVALRNAGTFAVIGDIPQARLRLQRARAAGIPEARIAGDKALQRAGLANSAGVRRD